MKSNTIMKSVEVTALTSIPFQSGRNYLSFQATAETIVTISNGAPFTLATGDIWAPIPTPVNDIEFSGAGTLITG